MLEKRVQADLALVKADVSGIKDRVTRLQTQGQRRRRDDAAMLVMMRGAIGVYEERMGDVEEDVRYVVERDRQRDS